MYKNSRSSMIGLLARDQCARRKKLHQSRGSFDSHSLSPYNSTRSSPFSFAESIHESRSSSSPSSWQRSMVYQTHTNENMEGEALEAKQRLDEKLRLQRESKNKRENRNCVEGRKTRKAKMKVYGSMKSSLRKFFRTRFLCCWNVSEVEDCAVCLEPLKDSESLIHLPCEHRFHSSCLKPWLDTKSQCPCCRAPIIST